RRTLFDSPLRAIFQGRTEQKMKELAGKSSYRVWDLMECELCRSKWIKDYPNYSALLADDLRFIDFCQLAGPAAGARRMEAVRVPVMVLQAADDPLCGSAQAV